MSTERTDDKTRFEPEERSDASPRFEPADRADAGSRFQPAEREPVDVGTACPSCGEPWLRPTQLPGRYRCVYCLVRFQLLAYCPGCGEHSSIVRMSDTAELHCVRCGGSMLRPM